MAGAAALVIAGSASAAQPGGSRLAGLRVGVLGGYERADVSGVSLRGDAELPIWTLTPGVELSGVASLGYSRLTQGVRYGELASDLLKLVPAARLSVAVGERLSLFGDLGLGLAFVSARTEKDVPFFGKSSTSASSLNAMVRLGVGAWYRATPRLDAGAMLELDPISGDYAYRGAGGQTTLLVLGGVRWRL